jgi:hypothetical protein
MKTMFALPGMVVNIGMRRFAPVIAVTAVEVEGPRDRTLAENVAAEAGFADVGHSVEIFGRRSTPRLSG